MKMKDFGSQGCVPGAPLHPPPRMVSASRGGRLFWKSWIRHCTVSIDSKEEKLSIRPRYVFNMLINFMFPSLASSAKRNDIDDYPETTFQLRIQENQ